MSIKRNTILAFLAALTTLIVASCGDQLGPDISRTANLSFAPVFRSERAGLVAVTVARIVARLQSSGAVVTDSVFDIAGRDSIDVGLVVPIANPDDVFLITLALVGLQNDTVFRGGPIEVPANSSSQPTVTPIQLEYSGVGATADSVVITGTAPTLFTGTGFTFQAVAYEGDSIVPGTPIAWSTLDSAQAAIPDYTVGQVIGAGQRGNARIVAELLTGTADTATVFVQPAPTSATIPSGNGQSGEVALQLPSPIAVQVVGGDGLGVQDAVVRFSGPGSFSPDTAVTDGNGDVQTLWTLGTVAGNQTAVATVDDLPAAFIRDTTARTEAYFDHVTASISATALAGPARQLEFAIQPVDTTVGNPIPMSVAVLDSLGNAVSSDNGRAVTLSIVAGSGTPGATLLGTNPVTTASGIAVFSDITPDSPGTGFQLVATAASLTPDTSVSFTVTSGVVSSIVVTPSTAALNALGATTSFAATGLDGVGSVVPGLTFQWSSSDSSAAVPDAGGTVTAIGNGTAIIAAMSNGVTGTATVTVQQIPAAVSVNPSLDTLTLLGDTTRYSATVQDPNGNVIVNPAIVWSLGDSSVAAINGSGLVTALANGSTSVTATSGGASGSAVLVVDLVGAGGFHWINASGGNWNNAANWDRGTVPGVGDTVYIDLPGTYTVTLDTDAAVAFLNMGAPGAQMLAIATNDLSIGVGGVWSNTTTLNLSGGSLSGTGGVLTSGAVNWSGGEFGSSGNGTLFIDSNGTLTISGGTKTLRAYTVALDGTGTWTAGTIQTGTAGTFVVSSNGVLDIQGDLLMTYNLGGAASQIDNAGTIQRTTGTGTTQLNVATNNAGSLSVTSGELRLTQGGVSSGSFDAAAGTILDFGGGSHTLVPGSVVSGAGEIRFAGGTTSLGGNYSVTGLTNVSGGVAQFSSGVSATTSNLSMSGGRLEGTGTLSVSGNLDWTGGEFGNTGSGNTRLESSGTFSIAGATKTLRGYRLTLDGIGSWTAGTIQTGSTGILEVGPNGILEIQGDVTLTYNLGGIASRVDVTGAIRRTVASGVALLNVAVNNNGVVEAQTGQLSLGQGGAGDGAYTVSAGAILDFTGGVHTLGPASSVGGAGEIRYSAGTAVINGAYNVTGLTNVSGGIAQFESGVTSTTTNMTISSGRREGNGVLSVTSTLDWTGGEFGNAGAGTTRLEAGGSYSIAGGTKTHRSHTLSFFGGGVWTAGTIQSGSGAIFSVESGGSLDIQGDVAMTYNLGGGAPRFDNSGTVIRSTGTGIATLNIPFNGITPSSAVDVQTGTLLTQQGGTWSGTATITSGAFLDFASGSHDLTSGLAVTGAGTARLTGGTMSIPGSSLASFDQLTISGGTLTGAGIVDVANILVWSGGSLSDAANAGTLRIGATAVASFEGATKNLSRIVQNLGGTVTWTAGNIQTGNGGVFDNQGTFDIQGDLSFTYNLGGAAPLFDNGGLVVRSAGTGTATLNVPFTNQSSVGLVDVQTGILSFGQNSTWTGPVSVASGTSFDFSTGAHQLNDGFTVSGPAPTRILGANVSVGVGATATFDELTMSGGTIAGAGIIDVVNSFDWSSGNMNDAASGGVTRIGTGAVATITTNNKNLQRVFQNDGQVVWTSGTIQTGSGGIFDNRGTFEIQGDLTYTYNLGGNVPSIQNSGIVSHTSGTGTTTFNVDVSNQVGGTMDIQTGTVALLRAYTDVTGSLIQGNGTLDISSATVSAIAADIAPGTSPGILALGGDYVQDAAARLNIEIGGPTPGQGTGFHDQLNVSGIVNLTGGMDVTLFGGYTPALGDLYTVATYTAETGAFSGGISLPPLGGGFSLDTRLTPNTTEIGVRQISSLALPTAHLAVNPGTDTIYVAPGVGSNQLMVFDVASGSAAGVATLSGSSDLIYVDVNEDRNKIYVVDGVEIGVNVVDGTDRTVLSQMSVGIAPRTLAWHAGTDSVYVMAQTGASSAPTLYVIDGTSPFDSVYNQSTTILGAAGTQPGFVTVDEQNDRIYAGLSTGFVVRLQASTKTIIDSVAVGTSPQGIAVNPATRTVYVADIVDKTITVIDDSQPAATAVIATILTPGGTPEHVDADRSNGMIYVAEQTGITVIDGNTNTIRTFIADTPASPHQVAFHPGRGLLYFTNSGSRTITGTRP